MMRMHWHKRLKLVAAFGCLILAAGCQTMPRIPGSGVSALDAHYTQLRQTLAVSAVPFPRNAAYVPFRCNYRAQVQAMGSSVSSTQPAVTVTPVRDRLLVTITDGANTSTALIGTAGHLYDFNMANFLGGGRYDSGTYQQVARQWQQATGSSSVINEFTLVFPQYVIQRPSPGQAASHVVNQDNVVWAKYIYQGLTTYNGVQAALFDLTVPAGYNDTAVVGFSLVDTTTMAPVLTVVRAGSTLQFERVGCT